MDLMTIQEFHKGMREHFDIREPGKFLDQVFLPHRKIRINIILFDNWLIDEIGCDTTDLGLSIRDVVCDYFGQEALTFIEKLI